MVNVLFFANLQERMNVSHLKLAIDSISVTELKQMLEQEYELPLDQVMIAVNEEIVPATHLIYSGDEVALLPPVSGG